jgi:arylsulfatase A-like enzyme
MIAAIVLPSWIGNGDWNGLLEGSFNLLLLVFLSVCVGALRRQKSRYSIPLMATVVLVSGSFYWLINASGFLWAKDLGKSDSDIAMSLQQYAGQNISFGMLESVFNPGNREVCGELCLTFRQYTNIRNPQAKTTLHLVDSLVPTRGPRPNIFILVIDSLRPDYLGAYNPSVDFTPNIDALARDSVVMRNAFTQYAGTSLSEPAIWSGALLLHAHYMRPFENVNSLLTLGKTDGYEMVVSRDQILGKLLQPENGLVFLDTTKDYNEFEISSTLQQLETHLDAHRDQPQPILFYAQPMNIHELGVNNLPKRTESNWHRHPGFNDNVAFKLHQVDDSLGQFFAFLKARHLYESSIIIVTADHGDATPSLPGFGLIRRGHSFILFPEIMRVPLIIHLPPEMRRGLIYDENRLAALTDITPSLYYLLGHRPIKLNSILGRPLFAATSQELHRYDRDHLFLASDSIAAYGILSGDMRTMYATYDSPQLSLLFNLQLDRDGTANYLAEGMKAGYDRQILDDLQSIAAFYDFKPDGGSSGAFSWDR